MDILRQSCHTKVARQYRWVIYTYDYIYYIIFVHVT